MKCFGDSKGFYYLKFLEEVQPSEKYEDKYQQRMTLLLSQKAAKSASGGPGARGSKEGEWDSMPLVDVDAVLNKMKAKVPRVMSAPTACSSTLIQ